MEHISKAIDDAIVEMVKARSEFEEGLVREHFADTPIALACIERLRIMPWDIEVQRQAVPLPPNPDVDPADRFKLVLETKSRVVEYTPRRWEMTSVRSRELEETSRRHADRIRLALKAQMHYGLVVTRPDAFVKVTEA